MAGDLRSRGFEVTSAAETKETNTSSVDTAGWRIVKSNCVVFLLSKTTIMSASLQIEAEKVMRRKDALLIPAYLDDLKTEDLPGDVENAERLIYDLRPGTVPRDYGDAIRLSHVFLDPFVGYRSP